MKIVDEFDGLVTSYVGLLKSIISIVKLETRLARQSIFPLLLNVSMIAVIIMTLWMSTMALLGYCVVLAFDTILGALCFVVILNLSVLFGLFKYLQFNLKNMSFRKTRAYFSGKESDKHGNLKKTINCSDSKDGTNGTNSANSSEPA